MAKIMLVEDDNNLREIYEARLLAEGYEIVTARDGEEALAVAVKERPDLIISDVMMPKISGFDMLDILRSTPETKDVKVIMMTALSQAEDKERASKLGADRYLVKSQVTLEDVAKVAHEVLEGPQPTAASAPVAAVSQAPQAPAATVPTPQPTNVPVAAAPAAPSSTFFSSPAPEPVATIPAPQPVVTIPVTTPPEPTPTVDVAAIATSTVTAATPVVAGITDLDTPSPAKEPAKSEIPDIERPSAEVWATPAEDTPVETPTDSAGGAVASAEANVQASPAQSLAEEEAAIAEQIEKIIDTKVAETPAASTDAPAVATASATAEVPTMPALPEAAAAKPVTGGQKVIQPLDTGTQAGPSIHELAAKEEADNSTSTAIHPQSPADGGLDPNSLAL